MVCPSCGSEVSELGSLTCHTCGRVLARRDNQALRTDVASESGSAASGSGGGAGPSHAAARPYAATSFPPAAPGTLPAGYVPLPPAPARKPARQILIAAGAVLVVAACVGLFILSSNISFKPRFLTSAPNDGNLAATTTPSPGEAILYADSLTDGATGWENNDHCVAESDGFHVKSNYDCPSPLTGLTNVRVTVSVRQVFGMTNVPYGIFFRGTNLHGLYLFAIDGGGDWVFFKCPVGQADCTEVIPYTANHAIQPGLDTTNQFGVLAVGTQFQFYVNGTEVGHDSDASFDSGGVGLSVGNAIEAAFTDFTVTQPAL